MEALEILQDLSVTTLLTWSCSLGIIFGGIIPYVPQYYDIRNTESADGFSLYVCLSLLIANSLRILFWFGHPYEIPLLVQSIIMNIAMLAMIHLCVRVRNRTQIIPGKAHFFTENKEKEDFPPPGQQYNHHPSSSRVFWDFDIHFFWEWTNFSSYIEFMLLFTTVVGTVMYVFIDVPIVVETIGFTAVFTEAMLGAPQFYKNLQKKSTVGMSKKMVLLWTLGDVFKTCYFIIRETPIQFWICGFLQVFIDMAILLQVLIYKIPSPVILVNMKKTMVKKTDHRN
ncbi:PQ-loop repeat-containing protein 1-like isoform X1 [Centruroides sculpturatus]|uniref:PQ-loop repeat-containing protein 1-like isoform X1 n=2 Tax=Centruroides sculpturatus TaxID=218467 RepID=UPI000C6D1E9B|nr:PQ-loop repeat-containing protein 1-like isoform X1 [Centruroides sculpturatus]XP_023221962.1 PQ-loop repeat-containing protein 1-like isoform X1 [Centruroides sculpturatus]XP_023221963.1 PQ-loop repeat-containing protein 1-like isoform X1 [Centruroides sculpturatus]XP_023221965.1 PQ-loop repeat-containing protein 1-like isoform X1 [Centruroides sculpturatus]XP_023221966.1 PQ-loop repeat-containing protein 1-like isoform X1 [Centruroides sculpturatus]